MSEYKDCRIVNIGRSRTGSIHATLVDKDNQILISATLDYIVEALNERLPENDKDINNG